MKLPIGYGLKCDEDGDWWLACPPTHTIFSAPGEWLLIADRTYTREEAYSYACEELTRQGWRLAA